ncbi:MAG: hypothetical protein JSV18_00615 [Candidatus Bathyarchaeota archaeon]|nr:MAG: hypothetical protein JSV18_00615 [Candidatus Bathyarchaeota archaeon]
MKTKRSCLPLFPRVEARGNSIVIIEEDGCETLWGREEDEITARRVADEIQIELRSICYIKRSLVRFMNKLVDDLVELGVQAEHLDSVLYEGCFNIQRMLMELSE